MTSGPRRSSMGLSVPIADLLSPRLWRERYAVGIPLAGGAAYTPTAELSEACGEAQERFTAHVPDEDGGAVAVTDAVGAVLREIPDDTVRWHLRAAASELEMRLGIPLGLVVCKCRPVAQGLQKGIDYDKIVEPMEYVPRDARNFYQLNLPRGTVSIQKVRGVYFDTVVWEVTEDDVLADGSSALVLDHPSSGGGHVLPVPTSAFLLPSRGGYSLGIFELVNRHVGPVPKFWHVDYTLGLLDEHTGEPSTIEAILAHWVYLRASRPLLSMAGLAVSQGIASTSVSFDGFSRNVSLQASAIYGLNSALEHVYEALEQSIEWQKIRAYKGGIRVRSLGR